jgi:hypothetical protein
VLAVVLQQAISHHIPGASGGLSGAAALHGAGLRVLGELTSAFGVSFWWVVAIAAVAAIPAIFIPARAAAQPAAPPAPRGDPALEGDSAPESASAPGH